MPRNRSHRRHHVGGINIRGALHTVTESILDAPAIGTGYLQQIGEENVIEFAAFEDTGDICVVFRTQKIKIVARMPPLRMTMG
jgi:hypothetical protein